MKIGIYIGSVQNATIGGGATFQSSVVEALRNIKTSHQLIFYYRGEKENTYCKYENFINLNSRKYKNLKARIKKEKTTFDEIIHEDNIDFVYYMLPEIERVTVPYIMTVWDLGHRTMPCFPEVSNSGWTFEAREDFYQKNLLKASKIVIGNDTGKNQLKRYYGADEEKIVTNPMITPNDIFEISPDDKILEKLNITGQKYIFYPAAFWPHKNHIRIVKAMKKLKEQGFKAVFSGADIGNMDYIKECVKEYGLEKDVIFAGFITKEELKALYKHAYALVYASMLGPDNIPPLEAMACRCPVICSTYEGAKDQLKDCALYFDMANENEIVEKTEELENSDIKEHLLEKGYALAKNCSSTNYAKRITEIFEELALLRECWSCKQEYTVRL